MPSTSSARYTNVAIALHWAIAIFIIFNLSLGFFMEGFPKPLKNIIVPLHISSGMTVLALTILRILWRLTHRPPPLHPEIPLWERATAHTVHTLLYALMLYMTLSGWSVISAHPPNPDGGPKYFGTFHLVQIGPLAHIQPLSTQKAIHEQLIQLHLIGGYIFVALLLVHIAAALKHQYFDRQPELERMGLGRSL
jgi:cytochrome b561